jgi:hypothetical protein
MEALDFILESRPEPLSLLTSVRQLVVAVDGVIEDSSGANAFRFVPAVWDSNLKAIKGDPAKWSKTGRGLLAGVAGRWGNRNRGRLPGFRLVGQR